MVVKMIWGGYGHYYGKQELVSWSESLLIATFNGHFPICKFIIEIIKDVHKAITWGKTLLLLLLQTLMVIMMYPDYWKMHFKLQVPFRNFR